MPPFSPESDIAIQVRGLGKKYTMGGPQEKYHAVRDGMVKSLIRISSTPEYRLRVRQSVMIGEKGH